jgi:hypothetical protein
MWDKCAGVGSLLSFKIRVMYKKDLTINTPTSKKKKPQKATNEKIG